MTGEPTIERLLNAAQEGLPLVPRPYEQIGQACGISEEETIALLREARARGLVRETSGIFDAAALGYRSVLAAMQVGPESLDTAAAAVSRHPGVSHNYARDHAYNLWFTLAIPGDGDIEEEIERLSMEAGGWPLRSFPTLRRYKIGVRFDLTGESASGAPAAERVTAPIAVDDEVIRAVRALQEELPLTPRPFEALGAAAGMPESELLAAARRLQESGAMRRLAPVLHHRAAGYTSNVMSVWDVAASEVDRAGEALASLPSVSHCYRRPSYPDWPYELFAMIHARSDESAAAAVEEASARISPRRYALLRSVKEYKKERVRYFGSL